MLGKFQLKEDNTLRGELTTYSVHAQIALKLCTERKSEDSPTHDVFILGAHGKWAHAGAAWLGSHAEHGNYFSISLEVKELFEGGLSIMAGESSAPGEYIMRYSREKQAA